MKAIINGISVEGTPQEIMEFQRLHNKLPTPRISDGITIGGYTNETSTDLAKQYRDQVMIEIKYHQLATSCRLNAQNCGYISKM